MGNATNETTKKTNWLDAIKAQFKRIIWPTKEEVARRSAVVLAVWKQVARHRGWDVPDAVLLRHWRS